MNDVTDIFANRGNISIKISDSLTQIMSLTTIKLRKKIIVVLALVKTAISQNDDLFYQSFEDIVFCLTQETKSESLSQ